MQIPQNLPQFEVFPAVFLVSGQFESVFYLANKGQLNEINRIKMTPRDEAKEKQGFTGHKAGMFDLSSVSHQGRYLEDLKMKFTQKNRALIHDLILTHRPEEICLFAPRYVQNRILESLNKNEKSQVRMCFEGNHIKESPLEFLKKFQTETIKNRELPGLNILKD